MIIQKEYTFINLIVINSKYQNIITTYHLNHCCEIGNLEALKWLIGRCDYNKLKERITDNIITACKNDQLNIVEYLVDYFNIHVTSTNNKYFEVCCNYGSLNTLMWLTKEFDIDIHYNGDHGLRIASECGHLNIVKWFCENFEINIHAKDDYSFRFASFGGHDNVIKYIVENFKVDHNINQCEPFRLAARNGHISTMELLVKMGDVDVHALGDDALITSWENGKHNAVIWLLTNYQYDSMIIKEFFFQKIFKQYILDKNLDMVQFLVDKFTSDVFKISDKTFRKLCEQNSFQMVKYLLGKFKDIYHDESYCLFKKICKEENIELATTILEYYPEISSKAIFDGLFYDMCQGGIINTVKFMIENLNIDIRYSDDILIKNACHNYKSYCGNQRDNYKQIIQLISKECLYYEINFVRYNDVSYKILEVLNIKGHE